MDQEPMDQQDQEPMDADESSKPDAADIDQPAAPEIKLEIPAQDGLDRLDSDPGNLTADAVVTAPPSFNLLGAGIKVNITSQVNGENIYLVDLFLKRPFSTF